MAQNKPVDAEILSRIVEEVDPARETLELVSQLYGALPIRSFAEVHKACRGQIKFRGNEFDVEMFEHLIPEFVFPIEDMQKLVELSYQVVRMAPPGVEYDLEDPKNAARELRRSLMQRLVPDGGLRPTQSVSSVFAAMTDRHAAESSEREG